MIKCKCDKCKQVISSNEIYCYDCVIDLEHAVRDLENKIVDLNFRIENLLKEIELKNKENCNG